MLAWLVFAGLTVALVLALLWALRSPAGGESDASAKADLAVYRDQLAEIDRDLERGAIAAAEAEAARNEISRRLLAADRAAEHAGTAAASPSLRRLAGIAAVVGIPVLALALYLPLGRPDLPAVPHAERMANALAANDFPALVLQVEEHLAANPGDARGWTLIAPAYRRLERFTDAANAFAQVIRLEGPSADVLTEYGETLILANQGLVSAEARKAFDEALKLDPKFAKARFYSALALSQEGKNEAALAIWRDMLAGAPGNVPWRAAVERQIAAVEAETSKAPALDKDKVAAIEGLSDAERAATIRAMVERLDARLAADGNDLEGWLKLARARSVLGDKEAAREALGKAEAAFKDDTAALARIASMRKELELE
jgi:cytochrome c-type biogenesis protein CcmH